MGMGSYIKNDRNLGGGGGWQIADTISNSDVIVLSNNDVIFICTSSANSFSQLVQLNVFYQC